MNTMLERIESSVKKANKRFKDKEVIIYGCTVFLNRIYKSLSENKIVVDAIIDNGQDKIGKTYLGIKVHKPEEFLIPYNENRLVIVCSVHEKEMIDSLKGMGYNENNILHISSKMEFNHLNELEYVENEMQSVRVGYNIYQKLQQEYGDTVTLIMMPRASGDVFIACSYLKEWCKRYEIDNYVLVGTGRNFVEIANMFQIVETRELTTEEKEKLLKAYMFLSEYMQVKVISEWVLRIRNSYFARKKNEICFVDKFRYETFGLPKGTKAEKAIFTQQIDIEKYRMNKEKTIIIAPYAYSSPAPMISKTVWEKLVKELLKLGYTIYTLGYGEKELAIDNTECIQFSYAEANKLLEYAGGFIGARSGLCDIVHSAVCKKVIIYGNSRAANMNFWSLKNNFDGFTGKEIMYEDYTEKEFIDYIRTYFGNEE